MTSVSTPFIIPDEGRSRAGAEGELERRKFTAEEGDHLTLLNVYAAFVNSRHGKQSAKWCGQHRLNFKALSRAVNIRAQLLKYLQRFGIDVVSCEGDGARLRKCIAAGFFKNAARVQPDGSYRSVRENAVSRAFSRSRRGCADDVVQVLHVHPSSVLFSRVPPTKYVVFHEVVETSKRFMRDLTVVEEVGRTLSLAR
jgi:ATP-dependent RNA helicase DDX35